MLVTLNVSKLSGWLNTDTPCRVARKACAAGRGVRPGRRVHGGGGGANGMHRGGPTEVQLKALGARARAERSENILAMLVTLDVSRLSGWLNADAPADCQVRKSSQKGQSSLGA